MTDERIERGPCRFVVGIREGGKPIIRMEFFHNTVPVLKHATLSFNLLGGLSQEQAKKIADSLNENVLDASIILTSQHPMFEAK